MRTGDKVKWGNQVFVILTEYDDEFVYLAVGNDGAQLVHVSELEAA